jgi:hypothetical protein
VVRDEVLCAAEHPRQVAAAQLLGAGERQRDAQARGIGEGLRPPSAALELVRPRQPRAHLFGAAKVEAEQITTLVRHWGLILTSVDLSDVAQPLPGATEQASCGLGLWLGGQLLFGEALRLVRHRLPAPLADLGNVRLELLTSGLGLEPRRPRLVAVLELVAEQPPAALLEPAPVALAAPLLGALVEREPTAPVSPQLALALARAERPTRGPCRRSWATVDHGHLRPLRPSLPGLGCRARRRARGSPGARSGDGIEPSKRRAAPPCRF